MFMGIFPKSGCFSCVWTYSLFAPKPSIVSQSPAHDSCQQKSRWLLNTSPPHIMSSVILYRVETSQPPCRLGQWRWTRGHCPICMHNDAPVTSQGSSHCALAARLTAVLGSLPKPGEVVTDVTTHFLYLVICSPSFVCTVIHWEQT